MKSPVVEQQTETEQEAKLQHKGVRLERTFLAFDKENNLEEVVNMSGQFLPRRRYTTPDTSMCPRKEMVRRYGDLDTPPPCDDSSGSFDPSQTSSTFTSDDHGQAHQREHEEFQKSGSEPFDSPVTGTNIPQTPTIVSTPASTTNHIARYDSICSESTGELYDERLLEVVGDPSSCSSAFPPMIAPPMGIDYGCQMMEDSSFCAIMHLVPAPPPDMCYTTVLVRNIPAGYSQDELIALFRSLGYLFNFFYCPMDFRTRRNIGYLFIDLIVPEMARDFMTKFHNYPLPFYKSNKVCVVSWARVQGWYQNVENYKGSTIFNLGREFRPRLFDDMGTVEIPFPGRQFLDCDMSPNRYISENELNCRKVFVGGLSMSTSADKLMHHLSQFGIIDDVSIILNTETNLPRGFAFATFADPRAVYLCVENCDAHQLDGKRLNIRPYINNSKLKENGSSQGRVMR
jgi:RNA recognition motif-containing protein